MYDAHKRNENEKAAERQSGVEVYWEEKNLSERLQERLTRLQQSRRRVRNRKTRIYQLNYGELASATSLEVGAQEVGQLPPLSLAKDSERHSITILQLWRAREQTTRLLATSTSFSLQKQYRT